MPVDLQRFAEPDLPIDPDATPILGFQGADRDFSNFEGGPVTLENVFAHDPRYKGIYFPSVEHAYQAAKAVPDALFGTQRDLLGREKRLLDDFLLLSAGQAKRLGRTVPMRPEWNDELRRTIMLDLVRQKASYNPFRSRLLATGDALIVENNTWHDNFFGSCTCPQCGNKGENHLGRILMRVRAEERAKGREAAVPMPQATRPRTADAAAPASKPAPQKPVPSGSERFLARNTGGVALDKALAAASSGAFSNARPAREPSRPAPNEPAPQNHSGTTIAIIGTAGRGDDAAKLGPALFAAMVRDAAERVAAFPDPRLVSGGAAWADHVAVKLFLEGKVAGLTLHLPAEFRNGRFVETGDRYDAGRTANWYHQKMREKTGIDGLAEIGEAIRKGARVTIGQGFKQRNTTVAREADAVIAYTFGPGRAITDSAPGSNGHRSAAAAGLKDGGTADTWEKATGAARKIHVPLDLLARSLERGSSKSPERPAGSDAKKPAIRATMYFSYGRDARPGLQSRSTFEAILNGERTSTTRFEVWPGYERWTSLRPGDRVRFYEDRDMQGRWIDVEVTGTRKVDLRTMSAEDIEAWSRKEGWSCEAGRRFGQQKGPGVQIEYQPVRNERGEIEVGGTTRLRAAAER